MLRSQRQEAMLAALASQAYLSITEAVARFAASPATIRRDFSEMSERGVAERVRGGIRRISGDNLSASTMPEWFDPIKAAICRAAVMQLSSRNVVFIDGGTTTAHLGFCLPDQDLRIISNSLRLADAMEQAGKLGIDLFLSGGFLHLRSRVLLGPHAEAAFGNYHADFALLSAAGVDIDGISNTHELVVDTERVMIENADRVIVLADSRKLGRRGMCRICSLERIDILITDAYPETYPILDEIAAVGVDIISVGNDF